MIDIGTRILVTIVMALIASLSISYVAQGQTSSTSIGITCPDGFAPIPSGLACAATEIVYKATLDVSPEQNCPEGFERHPGVQFCVAANLTLDIQNDILLIMQRKTGECPKGFSKAVGSTICSADDLVLKLIDNEVILATIGTKCPKGFHQPEGVRFCIAKNLAAETLPPPPPPACPLGFIKPPGVQFCIASAILYKDESRINDIIPPIGNCPNGWYRPKDVNFCIPSTIGASCGSQCGTNNLNAIDLLTNTDEYKMNPCPSGTIEIWWDMPVYDRDGLFVIDSIPARFCLPVDLEPAG
ncbi:hypothetical protein [Microbulbifer sp. TYP-18]|uniref:hypothetical protein n=1 Tax=Microbulbifer sp. TYP-18 TaxID=3230024 RepID=UPI0034C63DD5